MAESAEDYQDALNKFERYCDTWKMKVYVDKTKIVIFRKGRMRNYPIFLYNNYRIERVDDFNYLGIKFSRTGSVKKCKMKLEQKATNAMYDVLRKARKHNLSIKCQVELFDKIVKPILTYGCEIWGFENIELLERVRLKFYKLVMRLKPSTASDMVNG